MPRTRRPKDEVLKAKIEKIDAAIEKKKNEINALKEDRKALEAEISQMQLDGILEIMQKKNLSTSDVIAKLQG